VGYFYTLALFWPIAFWDYLPNYWSRMLRSMEIVDKQEPAFVIGRDKKDYLRIGNINFSASLLKLPDQE
jgi:hypothetical protein